MSETLRDAITKIIECEVQVGQRTELNGDEYHYPTFCREAADAILAMPEMQALRRLYVAVGDLKRGQRYDDSTEVDEAYNAAPMSVHWWAES